MVDMLGAASCRVAAGTMTNAKYLQLSQSLGLNWNQFGLIADLGLRPHVDPIGIMTYDWVHNMLQDGVFSSEAMAFITRLANLWGFPVLASIRSKR
jgi:hypothetical protein